MNNPRTTLVTLLALAGAAQVAYGASAEQNWGQWRGPLQNGVSPNGNPPTEWSETKNVKWKVKIPGSGSATPIVWDNLIFVQTAVPNPKPAARLNVTPQFAGLPQQPPAQPPQDGQPADGRRRRGPGSGGGFGRSEAPKDPYQFTVIAVNRATGKIAWQKVLKEEVPHEGHHGTASFASGSPITDGETVFAYFGSRGLFAMDLQGNIKWQKDLGKMRTANSFGEGSSPALHGDTLVVNWDHEGEDFIAAFDKKTGKELWKQQRDERTTWVTPFIVEHNGVAQVVIPASGKVRSYDLKTGKEVWTAGSLGSNVIPTPVTGHGMVYVMSGHREPNLLAIKLGRTGDLSGTDAVAWSTTRDTPYVPSPLLAGDLLYLAKKTDAALSILDAKTGKAFVEAERLTGLNGMYASPVLAADRIYILGRDGGALVLKKGQKIEVLATNKLDDGFDASPAVAGSELFLRGKQNLYCIAKTDGQRAELK